MEVLILLRITFNHGSNSYFQIGGTYARPVILPPEVAIGAIGKIQVLLKTLTFMLINNWKLHVISTSSCNVLLIYIVLNHAFLYPR